MRRISGRSGEGSEIFPTWNSGRSIPRSAKIREIKSPQLPVDFPPRVVHNSLVQHIIFFYYFLGLFPGLAAGGLAYSFSLGHQSPLSQRYLRLFSLMMVYFTQMVVVYYAIHVSGFDPLAVEAWSQPLYQLIYSFYPVLAAGFFLELLQIPFRGWQRKVSWGLSLFGAILLLVLLVFYPEQNARIAAFRFWVQFVYIPLFLIFLIALVVIQFMRQGTITDSWKKKTVLGSNFLIVIFFPLFVLDALWPLLQMRFRIVPEGFNFFGFFFIAYNTFFLFRWRILLKDSADQKFPSSGPQVDKPRLAALGLTNREEEVLQLAFAGLGNQDISDRLGVSLGTVKNHVYHIFQKTGASSRRELITMLS